MCGITGIINKDSSAVDASELRRMNNLIAHRGPDGEGFYESGSLAFGHRRLAIIDLSSDGHQPMHFQDRLVITFNGEIYNYIEIREELKNLGYHFKSKSDTEVILAAYDKWGEDCVQKFNGMWAFAIHDKQNNIVFCSRDRFGVKPFYYRESNSCFKFGSEIKQLINLHGENKANKDLIAHYLFTGMHDHENRTFFEGVLKIPPSHNLIYDISKKEFSLKRYYSIKQNDQGSNYSEKLINAIKLRLRSDVKVGTCLSGGLDSSTIAAIASEIYHKESSESFNAIHAKSIEKDTDESAYAIQVADHAKLKLHITEPSPQDFKKYFDEVIYTQEEPFGSPSIYLQYFVMMKAKEINCKVMLDGQGGDETLLGYERYYAPAFTTFLKENGFWVALKEIYLSRKNNTKMGLLNIAKYIAGTFFIMIRKMYLSYKLGFFKKEAIPKSFEYWKQIRKTAFNIFNLQTTELYITNLQALLRYEDKNSMRHGIETRLPFLDYNAVETALNLPVSKKIHNGWTKFILREICSKYLPVNISWRKNKLGFNAPDKSWISEIKEDKKQEIQYSIIIKSLFKNTVFSNLPISNDWNVTWRIINIAAWERIFRITIDKT
jgi:asparagine synthase (glutamine-hydrolysing)